MLVINLYEAKTKLSNLVKKVEEQGKTITLCRNGTPVAQIVPLEKKTLNPLQKNKILSKITLNYNPFEPLSDDEWPNNNR
ncbi:MAG: hypothetical protein LDLANPLL_00194 [Turneriella sp.]|nr:hypothetical protein [Turneriella sp.]